MNPMLHVQGSPVYAPKRVRFHFAGSLQDLASANQPHSRCTSTPEYPVENNDQQQHFRLPDTLCAGGFVRVSLAPASTVTVSTVTVVNSLRLSSIG